ncbi:hypothetical protein EV363DRAFT_1336917 [Boletus edulis]|nr:hypothetical protein EV363DRAFT_1336917 [Boletus edulis]
MSSDKRRKRAAARLVFAPPPRRSSSPHCSSSPVSAHPPTTPCLYSHSGASQLTSLGSGAREPDCRADALARRSHPPSQLTSHPASRALVPGRRARSALAHPLPLSSIRSLSASSSRRPRVQSDVQKHHTASLTAHRFGAVLHWMLDSAVSPSFQSDRCHWAAGHLPIGPCCLAANTVRANRFATRC